MTESTSNNSTCNASKIADFFVTEFYSRLKKDPSTLYELYHDSGYLTWVGNRSEMIDDSLSPQSVIRAETKEKIRSAINLLDLSNCTTYVEVLECSKSINNSLCITAKGRMYIGEGESIGRNFVQNFLLTEIRPRWYFIRNDCLIFMDSELPIRQSFQTTAKIANNESCVAKNVKKSQVDSGLEASKSHKEQSNLIKAHSVDENKEAEKQSIRSKEDDEIKDLSVTTAGSHTNTNSHEDHQQKAQDSNTVNKTTNASKTHANTSALTSTSTKTNANAATNSTSASLSSPLDQANYTDSLDAKNNANINRSSLHKYEVTSYAGKLMGGALKNGNKVKGYAIHVPTEDKSKVASQNGSKKPNTQKDPKSLKDAKNKRKIFVHSLPTNVSDDQIREAVLNQLKVHGGGYVIDVERARASGRHWGIIELDSEFSCKTLLNNGLYLGGMEISIEKWKQINQSQSQNFGQNSSKFNNKNSSRQTGNNYHNSSGGNAKH